MDEQELMSGVSPEAQPPVGEAEKMLSQSEVNALIARTKQASLAKARQEVEREYQQRMEQQQQASAPQRNESQDGSINPPSQAQADALYQQVQERFNRDMQERQLQYEVNNLANMYEAKVNHAKTQYQDFDEVTKGFDPGAFPNLIYLVAGMENAGDIVYDLLKDKRKLVYVNNLAQTAPQLAQAELAKLAQSIATNRTAVAEANQYATSEPLNPLTPSRVAGSNGKMTVSDLRAQPWLRG